jgi:hypothetical protein
MDGPCDQFLAGAGFSDLSHPSPAQSFVELNDAEQLVQVDLPSSSFA